MENQDHPRILVVDNNVRQAVVVIHALTGAGYDVIDCADSLGGLIALEEQSPALVILAWGMPFVGGRIFLDVVRIGLPNPPPVVVLADVQVDAAEIWRAGASACLETPPDRDALLHTVRRLLDERRLQLRTG